jgi:hypothetical protein
MDNPVHLLGKTGKLKMAPFKTHIIIGATCNKSHGNQSIPTSILIMAAVTGSPNQQPSEFTKGRELQENM